MPDSKATETAQSVPQPATTTTAEPEPLEATQPVSEPAATAAKPRPSEAAQSIPEPVIVAPAEPETYPASEQAAAPSLEPARGQPESAKAGPKAGKPATYLNDSNKVGPAAYTLCRQQLLQELQRDKSPYFRGQKRLLRMSQYGQSNSGSLLNRAHWRSDMDAVLLEIMRRRVVERLCYFSKMVTGLDRNYLIKCEHWDDVKELDHRGCLLYLGPPGNNSASSTSASEYVPPRLSTMDMGPVRFGAKLAVHNMRELLGEKHLSQLRQQAELLRDGSLYLLGRMPTSPLQMMLWKLQGYMAWGKQQGAANPDGDSA
ncbi:hypothetical protein CHGG_07355 [Chaetomium globosum CBS 148.51]|uniref:Uncharacterized protein n=1 Tax=Chaetomium globosum (strain ATCC 6205 / CBS 148.51 / DSM 1962 / NBRC 6347 / NRRL 1970) TaxID=306901 RepID=Q2GXE9_CHAGB|nr:uncharacterized protein CHGG_07355 [Chaetomium globosum CBS 148.51]EAQ86102.1 hypothetical protein CHGG_07355 [Chaetomium globosum CBS 148.51]